MTKYITDEEQFQNNETYLNIEPAEVGYTLEYSIGGRVWSTLQEIPAGEPVAIQELNPELFWRMAGHRGTVIVNC